MYVKGNPVLSKMFAHCGLTLSETGLFFSLPGHSAFTFLLTEDHVKIAELMGFNYEEFNAAKEYEEFFKLLLTNQFFRPSRFENDTTEGHVKMFKELAEFLAKTPHEKEYTKRQIEDMFEPLKEFDFERRYKMILEVYDNHTHLNRKFNGSMILAMVPGYDKRDLQQGLEKFNHEHFKTPLERMIFWHTHTSEEIVEEYLRATDIEHMFKLPSQ